MARQVDQAILIPVKRMDQAKLRLSELLSPADRRRLGLAMLADVLRATEKWESRFLVTNDSDAEAVGLAFGCSLIADPGTGLNDALAAGTEVARAVSLLILPSDVPLVSTDDVASLFSYDEEVVIVPSADGGTNALLRRPPDAIKPCFGPGSAAAHRAAAEEGGLSYRTLTVDSLMLDIDVFRDLQELAGAPGERDSVRLAGELLRRYSG